MQPDLTTLVKWLKTGASTDVPAAHRAIVKPRWPSPLTDIPFQNHLSKNKPTKTPKTKQKTKAKTKQQKQNPPFLCTSHVSPQAPSITYLSVF